MAEDDPGTREEKHNQNVEDEQEGGGPDQEEAIEQTEERLDAEEREDEDADSDVGPDRSQRD